MKDPQILYKLAQQVVANPSLKPLNDGTTFCNIATQFIAEGMNYKGFNGLMANQIIDLMSCSDEWQYVKIDVAQQMANAGTWIIASQRGLTHGHVCTIIPGLAVPAGHWGIDVPVCVNIGKAVFIGKGINWAFQDPPMLYALKSSI